MLGLCDGQPIPVELQIVAFPQVRLGIGHDSVIDPWYGLSTANLLDAASMAIHLGHLTSEDQLLNWFQRLYTDNHLHSARHPKWPRKPQPTYCGSMPKTPSMSCENGPCHKSWSKTKPSTYQTSSVLKSAGENSKWTVLSNGQYFRRRNQRFNPKPP